MDTVIDELFMEWHAHGAPVLLAMAGPPPAPRPLEALIAASTSQCRDSGRLTWVVLAALIEHAQDIDAELLLNETDRMGDPSVLGVLSDAAEHRRPQSLYRHLIDACRPNAILEPFFHRVSQSPLATRLAREHAVDVFRRWNYWSSELQYLDRPAGGLTENSSERFD